MSNIADFFPNDINGTVFVASGPIAAGEIVTIRSDGKVEIVTPTYTGQTSNSPTIFESGVVGGGYGAAAYDSANNKIAVVYRDAGNSNFGTVAVGTLSGTSVTWASPVVFASVATSFVGVAYDPDTEQFLVSYKNDSDSEVYVIVGDASGGSISFGTAVTVTGTNTKESSIIYDTNAGKGLVVYVFAAGNVGKAKVVTITGTVPSFGAEAEWVSGAGGNPESVYSPTAQKTVITWVDGVGGKAKVATISGTTVSFGSEGSYTSILIDHMALVEDENENKIFIAYFNIVGGDGMGVVGTISGTSISFGTPVAFEPGNTTFNKVLYDSLIEKVSIFYRDADNANRGSSVLVTITGTVPSYSSETAFETNAVETTAAVYDPVEQKRVVMYADTISSRGESVVMSNIFTSQAGKAFGFANSAAADTENVPVISTGGITELQSGLTAGVEYWVNGETGALQASDTGFPKMGLALSATSLLVRGEV